MRKAHLLMLVTASLAVSSRAASFYADELIDYDPGVGFSPLFTHPEAALGEPSRVNPFEDTTDPFNPAYGTNHIVSIGAGGWLVVRFHNPILNHPHNPYGL